MATRTLLIGVVMVMLLGCETVERRGQDAGLRLVLEAPPYYVSSRANSDFKVLFQNRSDESIVLPVAAIRFGPNLHVFVSKKRLAHPERDLPVPGGVEFPEEYYIILMPNDSYSMSTGGFPLRSYGHESISGEKMQGDYVAQAVFSAKYDEALLNDIVPEDLRDRVWRKPVISEPVRINVGKADAD